MKHIKLNENSFSANVYKTFFETCDLPQTTCDYVPRLALAFIGSILLYPLVTIFYIPLFIIALFKDELRLSYKENKIPNSSLGLGIYIIAFLIYCAIEFICLITGYTIIALNNSFFKIAQQIGSLVTIAIIFTICWLFVVWVASKIENRKNKKLFEPIVEKKPNLIKEYYKSRKEKYCMKIEWLKESKESKTK